MLLVAEEDFSFLHPKEEPCDVQIQEPFLQVAFVCGERGPSEVEGWVESVPGAGTDD